ncbi:MAG TPA: response regulator [Anaeromyxobacteraceae bacterium]|nr:response regulator [Anaeromyxobacteraceae bacterium]
MTATILIVDGEAGARRLTAALDGHMVTTTCDAAHAARLIELGAYDLVLADLDVAGGGLAVLRAARAHLAPPEVVLLSAHPGVPEALEAMRQGAHHYLPRDCSTEDLLAAVDGALGCAGCAARHAAAGTPVPCERPIAGVPYVSFRAFVDAACERVAADYLVALMRTFHGNVTCAARHAGMQRLSLLRVLKRHGIAPAAFRAPPVAGAVARAVGDAAVARAR